MLVASPLAIKTSLEKAFSREDMVFAKSKGLRDKPRPPHRTTCMGIFWSRICMSSCNLLRRSLESDSVSGQRIRGNTLESKSPDPFSKLKFCSLVFRKVL